MVIPKVCIFYDQTNTEINLMNFESVYKYLLEKLKNDLPIHLTYHNAQHTEAVIKSADELCLVEELDNHATLLVKTAALFHDAGFLKSYSDHEQNSCLIAREILPKFDYMQEDIEAVCNLIMATELPQTPSNMMERILCDADLHYLGTDQYLSIAGNLFDEFKEMRIVKNKKEWLKIQIQFFRSHQYFTKTAQKLYSAKKLENFNSISNHTSFIHSNSRLVHSGQDILMMIVGVLIAGFALKGFLVPNRFLDGGVTGLSLLVHELYHFNLSVIIIAFNIPLIIASYFSVSKTFALRTFVCVLMLGACLLWVPYPIITSDKTLISSFGGFFLGIGIGFTMRAGCALDGIEVLALYTWKRTSFTITEIILGLNIIIFGIAALKFGLETSLYSVLTFFTASKTIDYVVEGIEEYTGVTIISGNSEVIKHRLVNDLGRGITVYKGERGFLPEAFEVSTDVDIIFTVITRLELRRLKNLVNEVDPKAFVFANTIKEASGGIIKKRHVE